MKKYSNLISNYFVNLNYDTIPNSVVDKIKHNVIFDVFHLEASIIDTEINERVEVVNNYLRKKYHLNPDLLICPLTKRPYILEISNQ